MICKSCKNKNICKHYEYFKNIDINITIQITECESYIGSNNVQPLFNPDKRPAFRQPLPSRGIDGDEEEEIIEDEEKVFVNIDDYKDTPQNVSIVDMFYERGQNND